MSSDNSLNRRHFLAAAGGGAAALVAPAYLARAQASTDLIRTIRVPFDHSLPGQGGFDLQFGLLAPFDPRRKTVIVVADGQQFYVSPRSFAASVGPIFGDGFNIVGIFGRASAPAVQERVGSGSAVNWREAYRLLRARQWIEDIDAVRKHLVGVDGKISLYGRSGGGLLTHQYVASHPNHVQSLFTQAAVNSFLLARYGLSSDHFWEELSEGQRSRLIALLQSGHYPRDRVVTLFQRQNFFVPRSNLAQGRDDLIGLFETGNTDRIAALEKEYQVVALDELAASARGVAANVRLFEFFAPIATQHEIGPKMVRPDLEVSNRYAQPLLKLLKAGEIDPPTMNLAALHDTDAEAFLLAGRWDHTCDYRTQIALASSYRNSKLVILDDDHVFHRLKESGAAPQLVQAVFKGFGTTEFTAAMARINPIRWQESTGGSGG